ncbi:MAG: aldehyde:ferredoxin oxidoreductase [Desulfobacteraceae bacterium]|nr:aldehyde:ferredoxin oxidoreductase [Desulfobacteraceae bacterium]
MNGYAGKILYIDLTKKRISTIPTSKYESWVGGHGMGSAVFFDLVKDKTIDGFNPDNVVTMMTSPLSGTITPAAAGRTELQGIGVQSYPIGWFTRSNFGGRFAAMLKYAGWDGVAIRGKASEPVWVDIRDDDVKIKPCAPLSLWGKDTVECQEIIWDHVAGKGEYVERIKPGGNKGGTTTQRPAVVTVGPAGENMSIPACLMHDAGDAAGQGGFGAVWGSKNLKAVSVIGTGAVPISDPKALLEARIWQKKNYQFDLKKMKAPYYTTEHQSAPMPNHIWRRGRPRVEQRPAACVGCYSACRVRLEDSAGNEAMCFATVFYWDARSLDIQRAATDLINKYGVNAVEMIYGLLYIYLLNQYGQLKSEGIPKCPLDFSTYGSEEFVEQFIKMVAYGDDGKGNKSEFGKDIAGGIVRAAKKWGRLEQDLKSGLLWFPYWGLPVHKESRAQVYWGYGTILGDRDINEHCFDWLKWEATYAKTRGGRTRVPAERAVEIITGKMVPYQDDPLMMDFSDKNIYSEHMAKFVSWHRYYTRFWKQSALFCDNRWPDFINIYRDDRVGSTGLAEPKFFNAVTGKNMTFLDGIELGKKIWNLDNAIWTLQGRHRDMVHFADYYYNKKGGGTGGDVPNAYLPGLEDGVWDYRGYSRRKFDRAKFEEFKTTFYKLQGWDPESGYPTKATLESMDLGYVADELEKNGKLGRS